MIEYGTLQLSATTYTNNISYSLSHLCNWHSLGVENFSVCFNNDFIFACVMEMGKNSYFLDCRFQIVLNRFYFYVIF